MKVRQEHIKSILTIVLIIVMIVLAYHYFHTPSSPKEKNTVDMLPPPGHSSFQSIHNIAGKVLKYGSNPQGDIDKMLIDAAGNTTWLHFPPHTARQMLSIAKLQQRVSIKYIERPGKKGDVTGDLRMVENSKNEMVDLGEIPPPPPTPGEKVSVTGNKVDVKQDESGRITAFVLSGKLIVLPPHAAGELLPLLTAANVVEVKGTERNKTDGFVNITGLPLVRPDEIIINSVHYLVR